MTALSSPVTYSRMTRTPVRLTRRGRRVLAVSLAAPMAGLLLLGSGVRAQASDHGLRVTTTVVQPGQNLWDIAEQVAPTSDPRATVLLIEHLNGMTAAHVDAGTLIVVPAAT